MIRLIFLIISLSILQLINGQYHGFPYYEIHSDGFQLRMEPEVIKIDSLNINDCSNQLSSKYYDCNDDFNITYYKSDSSISQFYHVEKGKAFSGKKYGKWIVENGSYRNSVRIKGNEWIEHYFNGYLIPYAEHVSDSIYYDFENKTATCIMTHFGNDKFPDIKIRLDYFTNVDLDTTFVKCSTFDNRLIFSTITDNIREEIKMLIDGLYNRKIYVH